MCDCNFCKRKAADARSALYRAARDKLCSTTTMRLVLFAVSFTVVAIVYSANWKTTPPVTACVTSEHSQTE